MSSIAPAQTSESTNATSQQQPEQLTEPTRSILVVGATGMQGRSFVSAVLSTGAATDIRILAVTRSLKSPRARALADAERVKLVEADLDRPETVRKVFENEKSEGRPIWGVFLVLAFPGLGADGSGEERQGKLVADLSLEYGVQHLIYSSAERAGESYDDQATLSRHAKVQIERHIKSLNGLRWTIIRPVFFMENFDGTIGRITTTVLRVGMKQDTKLQLVSADDIGHVALAIFLAPEPNPYIGQAITVVGDALTTKEMAEAYKRGTGQALPGIPAPIARAILAMNKHTKDLMAHVERVHAYRAPFANADPESNTSLISRCMELYPTMKDMEAWARGRGTRKDRPKGWNSVSIGDLLRGKR